MVGPDPDQESTLFVGHLPRNVTEQKLEMLFQNYGKVMDVKIMRDKVTHNVLGYGFVTMSTKQEAQRAKSNLHGFALGDRYIAISWARKNTNLFIGDLSPSTTDDDLRRVFSGIMSFFLFFFFLPLCSGLQFFCEEINLQNNGLLVYILCC